MKSGYVIIFFLIFTANPFLGGAQEKSKGPVISEYGAVWRIPEADFKTDVDHTFKVVFDIMASPEDPAALNRSIETAARFYNMHAQAGVPKAQLKVALVVHNKAAKDMMDHKAYREKYNTDNPNAELLTALMEAGAQVIFCGQSSKARNIPKEALLPGVRLSLSAMTALIQLQNDDYSLIKF